MLESHECEECLAERDLMRCTGTEDVVTGFDEAFSTMLEIDRGHWVFKNSDSTFWRLEVDFSSFTTQERELYSVQDLSGINALVHPKPIPIRRKGQPVEVGKAERDAFHLSDRRFLHQFSDLSDRWLNHFEPLTFHLIERAAQFSEHNCVATYETLNDDETCPILLALQCLSMSRDLSDLWGNLGWGNASRNMTSEYLHIQDPCIVRRDSRPDMMARIDLWRLDGHEKIPDSRRYLPSTFKYLLKEAFSTIQKTLLRGQPRDWPTAFYAIGLLTFVYSNLSLGYEAFGLSQETPEFSKRALLHLSELFLYVTGDMHPMHNDLDLFWYEVVVGGDVIPMDHYHDLHYWWTQTSECKNS